MDPQPSMLAPPAVTNLRSQAGAMERTLSEDIREEREELREAAEQTLNVIVDLNLDGTIRWVSPSWTDVIGTQPESVKGSAMADLIVSDNKTVFADTVESMKKDDSRSQRVRFAVAMGPLSKLLPLEDIPELETDDAEECAPATIDLEAQGIMVYDGVSGGESHTMWMIRPYIAPREIKIDLPAVIVDSLGSGAEVLASYLTQLAESGVDDPENHPPPLPVLCRICERQISPWWFEKHTDLCLQEHRAEMDVQMAQDSLTDHRHSIVKVLDALEARKSRSLTGDQLTLPAAEYKGMLIGPPPSASSSPGSSVSQSRERSGGFGHSRARSFAIRRPQARIVELLLDLCDTAIEISTPAVKEASSQNPGEIRTQSPQSESRISQVMQWQSPSTNTLEQEHGLALLCADTEKAAKTKVEAVFRHRKIIEYAERIRIEFAVIVQDCIDEAMRKAARIAAGRLSDSTEDDEEEEGINPAQDELFFQGSFENSSLAAALQNARPAPPSIKDFEIIKPISKGAFGSVYLSKKKSTGEYFAIKVLKKADMVAKNQVGNVKAERAIMMWQGQSEFVAKLYWTFSSKDYLYLVMEYLNGGDCASLIKVLGGLPEDWVKKYLGEVVLGVEHLHSRGIIHRDLKPDNLLIDQKGHLKLTDFGLSRMGLVGRQKRALDSQNGDPTPDLLKQGPFARSASLASSRSTSLDLHGHAHSPSMTPQMTPDTGSSTGQPSYFALGGSEARRVSSHRSDSGGSETLTRMLNNFSLNEQDPNSQASHPQPAHDEGNDGTGHPSPDPPQLHHASTQSSVDFLGKSTPPQSSMMPPPMALFDPEDTNRRFVGTPDYLAPETIKGEKQDETSDWWSVGCIMFEFLYGYPPFHADEAEQVFENILARRIQWPDENECEPISEEAKDLINKLLCMEPQSRLGANREDKFPSGGDEIRAHSWFDGINWETLLQDEAQFVPQLEHPEDTEYFDARGAVLQSFAEEMEDQMSPPVSSTASDYPDRPHDALSRVRSQVNSIKRNLMPLHIPPHVRDLKSRRLSEPVVADDFGSFTFKNLPVLEKANKDVIQKLRAEALASQSKPTVISPGGSVTSPGPVLEGSPVLANPVQRTISNAKNRPQSPSGLSHAASSPSRASQPSSPLLVSFVAGQGSEGRQGGYECGRVSSEGPGRCTAAAPRPFAAEDGLDASTGLKQSIKVIDGWFTIQ
ncbi:hypothetical protein COL940_010768 [Colletotrichum noveboracense]|nr:hypothetical protein COL940_010768 [Colletotrichum noveboracense]